MGAVAVLHFAGVFVILQIAGKAQLLLVLEQQVTQHVEQDQRKGAVEKTRQCTGNTRSEVGEGEILGCPGRQGQQDQVAIQQEIGRADARDQHRQVHGVHRGHDRALHGQHHDAGGQGQYHEGHGQEHQQRPANHGSGRYHAAHKRKHQ